MDSKRQPEIEGRNKKRKKDIDVVLSEDAVLVYDYLSDTAKQGRKKELAIFNAFEKKKEILKENTHYGQPIAKKKIPKEYYEKFAITNLYWMELPYFWRVLYTITNDEIKIIAFVIDIVDHKKYDRLFGYR